MTRLRLILINIATDLNIIALHLRHSTAVTDPLVLRKELESLSSKLVEEASFVGEHRSSDPKVSDDELMQEIKDSESQSLDRLVPVLIGASRNEQPKAPPITLPHSSQQIPSAVIAGVDDDDDSDVIDSQSQEEEIFSLTTEEDVLNIRDLKAIAKSKHLDLVKRIEVAYFEATFKADVQFRLMFGQYNVWSLMNIAKSDFSRNSSSLLACEWQLRALLLLMEDRLAANAYAKTRRLAALDKRKKAELKSIDDDHFSMDLSEPALSLLTALQEEEEDGCERNDTNDNCPYHTAAKFAAKESGIRTNWINLVKFVQQMKTSMFRDTLGIIMCRVMQMVPFYRVAKCIKNENTFAFLDRKLSDWRDPKRSIADAWDSLIIPSLQDETPDVDMIEAYRLAVFIAQRLSFQDFEAYFQKAESIPLNKLFAECDAAQCLRQCKSDKRKSYFLAEDYNGRDKEIDEKKRAQNKQIIARNRRLIAARSFLLTPTFTCAVQRLRDRDLLGDGDIFTSVFGINCMAASKFVNPKYKLLCDEERLINPQRGDEECIWSLIEDISGLGEKAAKAFEGDYIILDLTQDVKDDTSKTLERLNDYFRLCIPSDSPEATVPAHLAV
eukprot:scaffold15605_cov78-Skeletonema_dohrnii-CCMP3373.AAC.4